MSGTVLRIIKEDGKFSHRVLMKIENYSDNDMILLKAEIYNLLKTMNFVRGERPFTRIKWLAWRVWESLI